MKNCVFGLTILLTRLDRCSKIDLCIVSSEPSIDNGTETKFCPLGNEICCALELSTRNNFDTESSILDDAEKLPYGDVEKFSCPSFKKSSRTTSILSLLEDTEKFSCTDTSCFLFPADPRHLLTPSVRVSAAAASSAGEANLPDPFNTLSQFAL